MSKKVVTVPLTKDGIENAIRELEAYRKWLEDGTQKLLDRLVQEGVDIANIHFVSAAYDGTNDVNCEIQDLGENKRAVLAVGDAVLFIEFGTGIKYPDDHPEGTDLGMIRGGYGLGYGNSEFGWVYTGDPGTNGEVITEGFQKGRIQTYGNPANKCMYYSRQNLENRFVEIAREVFKR